MEKKQFQLKFVVTVFGSAVIVLIFWLFVSWPLMKKADELRRDFELTRELLTILKRKESHFEEIKELDREVMKDFPILSRTIVSEANLSDFVVSLENLAHSAGVILTIDSLPSAARGQEREGTLRNLAFRLNVWGDFPAFYKFFRSLENFNYWVNIEEVKISRLDNFMLPTGPTFEKLTTKDIGAKINLSVFIGD